MGDELLQKRSWACLRQTAPAIKPVLQLFNMRFNVFGSRRKILIQKVEHIIAFALGGSSLLIADDVADEPEISQEFVINDVRELLASCYRSCLKLASEHELQSVAFCCISTGEFHFPNQEAARIAVQTVKEFLQAPTTVRKVIFNVFKDIDAKIYNDLL